MPTVSPQVNSLQTQGRAVQTISWADIATGDTVNAYGIAGDGPISGAVQLGGTFGGATVTFQMSNDGTTFYDIPKDIYGTTLSATAAAMFDFATAALYVKPKITGGTGDAVDVTLVLRTAQ